MSRGTWILCCLAALALGAGSSWYGRGVLEGEHGEVDHREAGDRREEGDEEHRALSLDPAQRAEFGIQVQAAGPGTMDLSLNLTGELTINPDAVSHVVPRIPGVVQEVHASLGDRVAEGDLLAVFDSRELALAKADFLASHERQALAQVNLDRERQLYEKKISSELDYLAAGQAKAAADIEIHSAEQRLHALGVGQDRIEVLLAQHSGDPAEYDESHDRDLLRYEMRAPIAGTIIEKHVTRGENLDDQAAAFVIADLSTVWADLTVYQKDMAQVQEGQEVVVSAGPGVPDARAVISYLSPVVDETTRAATARVVLPNPDGRWRPGLFVTGRVQVGAATVDVRVPRAALQTLEGVTVVFVEDADGFEPRPVTTGRADADGVEVLAGLAAGERYVAAGAFSLKAEWNRDALSGAGHAH